MRRFGSGRSPVASSPLGKSTGQGLAEGVPSDPPPPDNGPAVYPSEKVHATYQGVQREEDRRATQFGGKVGRAGRREGSSGGAPAASPSSRRSRACDDRSAARGPSTGALTSPPPVAPSRDRHAGRCRLSPAARRPRCAATLPRHRCCLAAATAGVAVVRWCRGCVASCRRVDVHLWWPGPKVPLPPRWFPRPAPTRKGPEHNFSPSCPHLQVRAFSLTYPRAQKSNFRNSVSKRALGG